MKKNTFSRRIAAFFGRISISLSTSVSLQSRKDLVDRTTADKIDRWIKEKRWAEDLNQEEVARSMNMRSEQLGQYFYTRTGKSFLRWRRETRMEAAKLLLLEDAKMPTVLVGEAVGIPDKSSFRRQFKEITGCTPAEWRRSKQ